jgi:hypothetical protein
VRTIYRASLDTRHFAFEAYDETDQGALYALNQALDRHCRQTGMITETFRREFADSIEIRPIALGHAYRDREPL